MSTDREKGKRKERRNSWFGNTFRMFYSWPSPSLLLSHYLLWSLSLSSSNLSLSLFNFSLCILIMSTLDVTSSLFLIHSSSLSLSLKAFSLFKSLPFSFSFFHPCIPRWQSSLPLPLSLTLTPDQIFHFSFSFSLYLLCPP